MGAPVVLGVLLAGIALVSATCTNRCFFTATTTHTTLSAAVRGQVMECAQGCCQLATCTHIYYGATDGVCTTVTNHATQIARNSDIIYQKDHGPFPTEAALVQIQDPTTSTSCYDPDTHYVGTLSYAYSGTDCIDWEDVTSVNLSDNDFPYDHSRAEAFNYCRAPGATTTQPFCYVKQSANEVIQNCAVPRC